MLFTPNDAQEAASLIADIARRHGWVRLCGFDSKKGWGGFCDDGDVISSRALHGIVSYEPEELLLTAKSGTPIASVAALLHKHRQYMAFDPPPAFSGGEQTLGGVVAAGLSGSRRMARGKVRDYVLAARAVNGEGKLFSAGAKVVKNVTGYDLPKLLTGSMGELAFLTEITIKTLPLPSGSMTLVFKASDRARELLRLARQSNEEVSAAAYVPTTDSVYMRIEGGALAVRGAALVRHADCPAQHIEDSEEQALWARIGGVTEFAAAKEVWRVTLPPDEGFNLLQTLRQNVPDGRYLLDWSGGLLWAGYDQSVDRGTFVERCAARGGHAFLARSSPDGGAAFLLRDIGQINLMRKVKRAFDPQNLFRSSWLSGIF